MAAMDAECIRSEIRFRFSRPGGPGGQHAQKNATRVEALFDAAASAGLTESERRRVVAALGPVVRAVAQDERSQLRNRELAVERMLALVGAAARPARPRLPTLPSAVEREQRLADKRSRAERKRLRRPPEPEG
jgi:ribosome-associated protein